MSRNFLWEVIQRYMDDPMHRYPPKPADLARETGVSDKVISKWKNTVTLPAPEHLLAFAHGTRISYAELLEAALRGKGYVPEGLKLQLSADIQPQQARRKRAT